MSYSIGVRAATKSLALTALAAKFDETVVAHQAVHEKDRSAALAAAEGMVNVLPEDESKDVSISINGYLSWSGLPADGNYNFTAASVTAQASLVDKAAA